MGFSTDMLDGFDVLYKRTEGGLKVTSDMALFFKKLAILEADHAKLRTKLSASFGNKKLLVNPHIDGTVKEAWTTIFKSLDTISQKQETFAHSLMKEVSLAMSDFVKEKDTLRKKLTSEGQKLTKDMKNQLDALTKARGNYNKASKESESAIVSVNKEVSGANQPKKVAQLQQKAAQAAEKAATMDQEYKDVLKTTNNKQQDYYNTEMPQCLNEFQQFEEERITFTKTMISKYGALLLELPPIYQQTSDDVAADAAKIDPAFDIDKFTQENKTGVTSPPQMEYQPYEINATLSSLPLSPSFSSPSSSSPSSPSRIASLARPGGSQPKEWGLILSGNDEILSVDQKRQKLEQQLTELETQIRSETTTKTGVEKLVQFYANDPPQQRKAESELAEAEKRIKALQEGKKTVKTQLAQVNGTVFTENSDENDENFSANSTTTGNGNENSNNRSELVNSGASGTEEKVVIVKVRGLFDYVATCDTELSFKEGDILTITEQDESGWWYAEVDGRSGFIPQNYVEVTDNNN